MHVWECLKYIEKNSIVCIYWELCFYKYMWIARDKHKNRFLYFHFKTFKRINSLFIINCAYSDLKKTDNECNMKKLFNLFQTILNILKVVS